MSRRQDEDCLSDLKLDRWIAGELGLAEQRGAELHVNACAACQRRRAEIVESRHHFTRDAPVFAALAGSQLEAPDAGKNLAREGLGRSKTSDTAGSKRPEVASRSAVGVRSHWLAAGSALAAAAAIALVLSKPWISSAPSNADATDSGTRTKGGLAHLSWVVRRGGRVFAGRPEQRLRAGDAVRFMMSAREPVYVAVWGLDAAGRSSVYFPEGDQLARIEAGRDQPLPTAIELDAASDALQVYAAFCPSPVPLSRVTNAVENAPGTPLLPSGCTLERATLQKEAP